MAVDPGIIGPATMSITQSLSLFQGFLPRFTDIRKENPLGNPEFVKDVRMGELAASLLTIGIGAMMSALTGSSVPAVLALITVIGLVTLYESALKSNAVVEVN